MDIPHDEEERREEDRNEENGDPRHEEPRHQTHPTPTGGLGQNGDRPDMRRGAGNALMDRIDAITRSLARFAIGDPGRDALQSLLDEMNDQAFGARGRFQISKEHVVETGFVNGHL